MLILRAHHLLCIQGYQGKGYDEEFVENMNKIVNILKKDATAKMKIIKKTDAVCAMCPSNVGKGLCKYEDKVLSLDEKTIEVLDLKEKESYIYEEVLKNIKEKLTLKKFEYICASCEWFPYGYCKKGLFQE